MLRRVVFTFWIVFLLTDLFVFASSLRLAESQPVDVTVPDDYPTIQQAINGVPVNSKIFVRNGTYFENVVVNKTVSLVGEDRETTIIDGEGLGTVVLVNASNVTVSGFTVRHSLPGFHYELGYAGILVVGSVGNNISHNIVKNNHFGLFLQDSGNNVLADNHLLGNFYNFAVKGERSAHFYNDIDTSNTVDGKRIYYLVDKSDQILLPASNAGAVYLVDCKNITVWSLSLSMNYYGVFLWNTTDSRVGNVTARDNYDSGVFLAYSNGNFVYRCTLTRQLWHGVGLISSNNNGIFQNNASKNWNDGIYSLHSDNNEIANNVLASNNNGIYLLDSNNSRITGNMIVNNSGMGIAVYSPYAQIMENHIEGNGDGLAVPTSNNTIYHNNFGRNQRQVNLINPFLNTWDNGYPSGGNYWSDYNGTDLSSGRYQNETGRDGIGDASYVIGLRNVDRYPLMSPWNGTGGLFFYLFKVVWYTQAFEVVIQTNSTVSDFGFVQPEKKIEFNVTGPSGTFGICIVTIPRQLLYSPLGKDWTILIDGQPPFGALFAQHNQTHTILTFKFVQSTHHVEIVGSEVIQPPQVTIPATVIIEPHMLNLKSRGKWITVIVELPKNYSVKNINVSSMKLNSVISPKPRPISIGDRDCDGIRDLAVKFDRDAVIGSILDTVKMHHKFGIATLTLTGELKDGTRFLGSVTIKVILPKCKEGWPFRFEGQDSIDHQKSRYWGL